MVERYVGVRISFVEWMLIALPVALVLMIVMSIYMNVMSGASRKNAPGADRIIKSRKASLGRWKPGKRNVAIAFAVTVALWVVPGTLPLLMSADHPVVRILSSRMPEATAALVGAILLFALPISSTERSTVTWKQADNIDWGTILLFGGGLALGELAFSSKLAEAFGQGFLSVLPVSSIASLTFASALFGVIISEAMSNTAAANIAVPIAISIAQAAGVNPIPPALAVSLAASVAVVLPVSTPPNAIVYASGKVPITDMIRYGLFLDAVAVLLVPSMVLLWF